MSAPERDATVDERDATTMEPPTLAFDQITKSFAGIRALKGIDLEVRAGAVLGLVGENGAGKTTLMNILGGVVPPDAGRMLLDGTPYAPQDPADAIGHGIGFIHQELNLFANLSIAENMFIDSFPRIGKLPIISRRRMTGAARPLLEAVGLEADPLTLVETLPPGERQLVEIAKALAANARIIIFDEPTTSLTSKETERLFGLIDRLRKQGTAVIYISHILKDVLELADAIAVLRDGELIRSGPVADFTIRTMIASMVGRTIDSLYPEYTDSSTDSPALEVRHLSEARVARSISFRLHRGEILGVFGLMGSGRTEMARMVFGLDPYDSGAILVDDRPLQPGRIDERINAGIAFVTEDRRDEGLLMEFSIAENLALVSLPQLCRTPLAIVDQERIATVATAAGKQLKIKSGPMQKATAKSLSGGNQQKVVIGKWLANNPRILILDEPTRGIDVGAKYEVYLILNRLAAEGTAVLVISSELDELMGICDRIMVMSRGEQTGIFGREQFDQHDILAAAFGEVEAAR